jgi:predicted transcriptional regulator
LTVERKISLTPSQSAILYVLTKKLRFAAATDIAKLLGWSEAHVRKILSELRKMELVDYVAAGFLGRGSTGVLGLMGIGKEELKGLSEMDPRTKLHYATITFEQLKSMSPDLEKWMKLVEGK